MVAFVLIAQLGELAQGRGPTAPPSIPLQVGPALTGTKPTVEVTCLARHVKHAVLADGGGGVRKRGARVQTRVNRPNG